MSEPKVKRIKSIDELLGFDATQDSTQAAQASPDDPAEVPVIVSDKGNVIHYLPPSSIRPHHKHMFKLYSGERLDDLVASVTKNGILVPTIIRRIELDADGYEYEMLAGHNRQNAAQIGELSVIPCIVKENITEEEATMYVIETNLIQRSFNDMLPSEKAAVLAYYYSQMFSQGKRNDIINEIKLLENPQYINENQTSGNDYHKLKSRDSLGKEYGLKGRMVAYYVRLDKLIPDLKNRLDDGEWQITTAVKLTYLKPSEQQMIEDVLTDNEFKIDEKKATLLQDYAGRLTDDLAFEIISGEKAKKPKSSAPPPVKIKHSVYSKYFTPDAKASEIEKIIGEALELYFSQNHKDNEVLT